MIKSNGYILFEGPSALDGSPIVVIATGLKNKSSNRKTGAMVQTYILRADMLPTEAVKTGADESICGDCPHRGDGTGKQRTCYVNVGQGAQVVYKAYKCGVYPNIGKSDWAEFEGKTIRFGTYGDPMAAPIHIWQALKTLASKTTGYTHQWRQSGSMPWAKLLMASADTPVDAREAHNKGFRTFRVASRMGYEKQLGEVLCPASEEAGKKLTCETCGACNGTGTGRKGSIFIPLHGNNAVKANEGHLHIRLLEIA